MDSMGSIRRLVERNEQIPVGSILVDSTWFGWCGGGWFNVFAIWAEASGFFFSPFTELAQLAILRLISY